MFRMHNFFKKFSLAIVFWVGLWIGLVPDASAASYEIIGVEAVFNNPSLSLPIRSHAIIITSSNRRFNSLPRNTRIALEDYFVYQTKVKVSEGIYYRLAVGNFDTLNDARAVLRLLRPTFSDAWIYQRTAKERQQLEAILEKKEPELKAEPSITIPETAESLLEKARQRFLDGNFPAVIAFTDRVIMTGNMEQVQAALELAGSAREREGKFAQAIVLYESLLDTSPPEETAARVASRLEGIRTMSIEPRERLPGADANPDEKPWIFRGVLHQYYRDDAIERPDQGSEKVNQVFVTDIDLQLQRRREADTLSFQIDAGLIADLLHDDTDNRISRASMSYSRDEFRIIAGRQFRTVTGVQGRFDGLTYNDLSHSGFQPSYFLGNLAQSPYDDFGSDNPLIGANLDFGPYDWLDVNLYVISQEVSGLTDRQAIGSEFQLHGESGFIYGIIDYDVFYQDLNNITVISNYRYDPRWTFNLSLGRLNAPTLATSDALQGQAATTIEELKATFTSDEIYQLAQDRSSKSTALYFAATYNQDDKRQWNYDISYFTLDATTASGGVDALPSTTDIQVSVDYSVRDFFSINDYTSMGVRLSDSDISEIVSLRFRSRIPGSANLIYDSRVQLDLRSSASSGVDQLILKPTIKLRYRATKNLDFEANFGFEYSDVDLPDFDRQLAYTWFLGYAYFF